MLINVWLGTPTILTGFQMIIVRLLMLLLLLKFFVQISCSTDFFASLALVYEPAESDLLERPPRNVKAQHLIDWRLLLYVYGFLGVFDCIGVMAVIQLFFKDQG